MGGAIPVSAGRSGVRAGCGRLRGPRGSAALLFTAVAFAACGPPSVDPADAVAQNLILISIDTLRADRLGAYGYARDTSPALDALAARGVRFETVIAESNWTLPSHVTLLSGLPPQIHGVRIPDRAPSKRVSLLAEVLHANGFRTVGLTAGRFLTRRYGFGRGFEVFDDGDLGFGVALAIARRKIAAFDPAERFFAFIHTYDVHCPYDPPADYADRFATRPASDAVPTRGRCGNPHFNRMALTPGQAKYLSDRYDGGIRYADDLLAGFLRDLHERGVLERTLVVVVSDHGEEFLEHGKIGHRATLHIQSLRIPWLMAGPGVAVRVVDEPVGLADVMPTVLELLDVPSPAVRGRSRVAVMRGEVAADTQRLAFSQNDWGPRLYSAIVGDRQIIVDDIRGRAEIFDWRSDPDEQVELGQQGGDDPANRSLWLAARAEFQRLSLDPGRFEAVDLGAADADERAQLEALGYVEAPSDPSARSDAKERSLDD